MSTEPDVALVLARWVGSAEFYRRAEQDLSHIEDVMLDTIAAIVAFDEDETFEKFAEVLGGTPYLPGSGQATLLTSQRSAAPLVAASVNGAQANASLLAEGHRAAGGHPAAHIVPAVLAAAEGRGSHGRDVLMALAAGYEVAVRIRKFIGPLRPGLSPNGNWATLGAAAGVAHLLSNGAVDIVHNAINASAALALTAPMSFGHQGTQAYRHFVGVAAEIGVSVGAAAAQGWTAPLGVVEGSFVERSTQKGPMVCAPIPGSAPLAICENYFKRHAVCAHLAAAADAALQIRDSYDGDFEEIDQISAKCGVPAAAALDHRQPSNRLAARYSLPFVCGVALVYGAPALMDFPAALLQDSDVSRLAAVTTTELDPALCGAYPNGRPTSITVRLGSGEQRTTMVPVPLGDVQNPMSRGEIQAKARHLLSRVFGDDRALEIITTVSRLHHDGSVADVSAAVLSGAPAPVGVTLPPSALDDRR